MKHLRVILAAVLAYAGGAFAADPATAPAADDGSPFVRLYDTGKPIDLSATGPIAAKPDAWRQVTEKDAAHAFEGDAAVVNDQLILLCSKKYDVAVCTKGVGGVEVRALLFPLDTRGGVSSVKIVENTASAVTLEATFKPAEGGEGTVLRIRLSAGAFYVQVRGASRTASLVIADRAPQALVYAYRHATTNDFFIAGDSGAGYLNPRALTVRPDSIFVIVNVSSASWLSFAAWSMIILRYSRKCWFAAIVSFLTSDFAASMMLDNGVRKSCDTMPTNSDFSLSSSRSFLFDSFASR